MQTPKVSHLLRPSHGRRPARVSWPRSSRGGLCGGPAWTPTRRWRGLEERRWEASAAEEAEPGGDEAEGDGVPLQLRRARLSLPLERARRVTTATARPGRRGGTAAAAGGGATAGARRREEARGMARRCVCLSNCWRQQKKYPILTIVYARQIVFASPICLSTVEVSLMSNRDAFARPCFFAGRLFCAHAVRDHR